MERNVLASEMWAPFHLGNPNDRYARFLSVGRPRFQRLMESILLHDQIVIPSHDFMAAATIVGVLGQDTFVRMLEYGILKFVRVKGIIGYIGNGGGLYPLEVAPRGGGKNIPWAPIDEAATWALSGLNAQIAIAELVPKIVRVTTELDIMAIGKEITHEAYMDVLNSNELREWFAKRSKDMNRLAGIKPDAVRFFGGYEDEKLDSDEIGTLLKIAHANVELRVADLSTCKDLNTASPIFDVLRAKQGRKIASQNPFAALRELANVPNIGEGVLAKAISIEGLLKLRVSRDGEAFREWFHRHDSGDSTAIAKEYIRLLTAIPEAQSFPGKTLRWIVSTALGAVPGVGPVLGPVVGAVDSFLVDKLARRPSPKFFIEKMTKLLPPDSAAASGVNR